MPDTALKWKGKEIKQSFFDAVNRALTKSAIVVQGKAVRLVPVDTGVLKSSIDYNVSKRVIVGGFRLTSGEQNAIIGTVVFYAPYVEFGTRFTKKAQPFLLPAYRNSWEQIRQAFFGELQGIEWLQ